MKKIKHFFRDLFTPDNFNGLELSVIANAFNNPTIRDVWLAYCFDEITRINMEVDRRLVIGSELGLTDLCARRKAFQDILEAVLSARRKLTQNERPNPRVQGVVDLDRVTA